MAFTVPTFPLECQIYTGPWATKVFRDFAQCNLAMGRRVNQVHVTAGQAGQTYGSQPILLLPALTDIRDSSCGLEPDFVQCPDDSGRWYVVQLVDDVAKGFENEYRMATLGKIFQGVDGPATYPGLFWPTPIP